MTSLHQSSASKKKIETELHKIYIGEGALAVYTNNSGVFFCCIEHLIIITCTFCTCISDHIKARRRQAVEHIHRPLLSCTRQVLSIVIIPTNHHIMSTGIDLSVHGLPEQSDSRTVHCKRRHESRRSHIGERDKAQLSRGCSNHSQLTAQWTAHCTRLHSITQPASHKGGAWDITSQSPVSKRVHVKLVHF